MDKKLTLSLNANVVEQAKSYARDHGISLSRMIENYLSSLLSKQDDEDDEQFSPLINRLIGVMEDPGDGQSYQLDYSDYLSEKYK